MHFQALQDVPRIKSRMASVRATAERTFAALDRIELPLVFSIVGWTRRLGALRLAALLTRLGNGAMYPGLSLLLIVAGRIEAPAKFLLAASVNVLLAFSLYPLFKQFLARRRPCDRSPSLRVFGTPLDRYSCPSGHTMMAVAYSITVSFASKDGLPVAAALPIAMGWSRVALGHHYPSDLLAGAALGAMVALPIAAFLY